MTNRPDAASPAAAAEIAALIDTLHETEQRLAVLTGGEVDAVSHGAGLTYVLQSSQEGLRRSELLRQSRILNALPAQIALLDTMGNIVSVNESWRRFARNHVLQGPGYGAHLNYLSACESSGGEDSDIAREAAGAIRAVLRGDVDAYTVEYACRDKDELRWFVLTATPLSGHPPTGAVVMHVDVTDRTRARAAMQRSADLLNAVVAGTPDTVFVMDAAGRYLLCNEAFARFVGSTPEELLALAPATSTVDGIFHGLRATDREVMETGEVIVSEDVLMGAAGTRTFLVTRAPYRDDRGGIVGVICISRDITERKRAEQALRDSQALLQAAGRLAQVGSWVVDLPARRVRWSGVLATIHGEPEGFSPTVEQALAYYAPEYSAAIRAGFTECVSNGTPFSLEAEIRRPDGPRIWVCATGEAVRDDAGAIVRVQGALQDLSERKEAERSALLLADALASTLESITDGFITLDRSWCYTFVNSEAQRLLGRPREQLIGKMIWAEFPELVGGEFERGFRKAMVADGGSAFETFHAPWNAWVAVHCYPSRTGLSIYLRDVTQQRRDRDALSELNTRLEARVASRTRELNDARQEAEQANRAKSSFLAAMSHEIRTPMNGVIGMIDVLEQSSLKSAQADIVKTVRQSAYALLRIVDDVLDFSKIEAGHLQIDHDPMSIELVVEQACDTLDRLAGGKGVRLRLFVDPAIPSVVRGDAARLRQVLLNLVGNAIKFSSADKRIGHVSLRATLAARRADAVTIAFSVRDDGIGMTAETLARLFTPFTQADNSTTKQFGGTGLGLSISRRLVELMGGGITVSSQPGSGSTFVASMPFAVDPAPVEPAGYHALTLRGLRCVMVGGDPAVLADFDAYLQDAGVRCQQLEGLAAADRWFSEAPLGLYVAVVLTADASHAAALADSRSRWAAREHLTVQVILIDETRRGTRLTDAPGAINLDGAPVRRANFIEAVALAGGRSMAAADDDAQEDDTVPMPIDGDVQAMNASPILVAEDNDINRKVIGRQLELLGFAAEIVSNGSEALDRWRSGDYAMLLTDLHMPVMDGYELTVAIRREESGSRMPIVALTANALKGEARRCEALGMDDFMTKPMQLVALRAMLQKWMPHSRPLPLRAPRTTGGRLGATLQKVAPVAPAPAVDLGTLAALVGDDPRVLAEMLASFSQSASRLELSIRGGLADNDCKAVVDAAHSLKSGARSIGAWRLAGFCEEIEAAADSGRTPEMRRQLVRFRLELADVLKFIATRGMP